MSWFIVTVDEFYNIPSLSEKSYIFSRFYYFKPLSLLTWVLMMFWQFKSR